MKECISFSGVSISEVESERELGERNQGRWRPKVCVVNTVASSKYCDTAIYRVVIPESD